MSTNEGLKCAEERLRANAELLSLEGRQGIAADCLRGAQALASALLRLEEAERRIDRAVLDLSLMAAELTRGDLGRMTALAVAAEIKRHVAALKADANADHHDPDRDWAPTDEGDK